MARIPDAELQHQKAAVPLVTIIEQLGRQWFKRGKDMTVLCPFHQEQTPSNGDHAVEEPLSLLWLRCGRLGAGLGDENRGLKPASCRGTVAGRAG